MPDFRSLSLENCHIYEATSDPKILSLIICGTGYFLKIIIINNKVRRICNVIEKSIEK